ncbi:uncharacterized protein YALI1_D28242g [Yarrowia lipolytica]|uniref:Uncharacterized protein n=1 Tax=Yarrowia lipolytica TaxID=4952 RepID=A0A1D8NFR6_YARLL|nr:hypothetical protein YALI1_D28242g [Yarrowia lipolytica]
MCRNFSLVALLSDKQHPQTPQTQVLANSNRTARIQAWLWLYQQQEEVHSGSLRVHKRPCVTAGAEGSGLVVEISTEKSDKSSTFTAVTGHRRRHRCSSMMAMYPAQHPMSRPRRPEIWHPHRLGPVGVQTQDWEEQKTRRR